MDDLKQKSIQTVRWTFLYHVLNYTVTFALSIILARLISPSEFGLTAMLSIFISIANILINSGLSSSLIRYNKSSEEDYTTVFYFNILISLFLYLIMFISAPWIAEFYEQPELILLTRTITLVFVLNSFGLIQNTVLVKALNFKKQTIINFIGLLISVIIGIIMAFQGYGIYSIVGQTLSQSFMVTTLLWITSKWRPHGFINLISLKKLWSFGSYVLFTGIFNSIAKNLDDLIVGKVFSASTLGFFVRAKSTRAIPENIFSNILSTTTFSVLSKLNDNPQEYRKKHNYFFRLSVFLFIPLTFGLNLICDDIVILLYGKKWLSSIPLLQILSIGLLPSMLSSFFNQSLIGYGDSKTTMKLNIIKRSITLAVLPSGLILEISSFVLIFTISQYIGLIFDFAFIIKNIKTKLKDYLKAIYGPIIASYSFIICHYLILNHVHDIEAGFSLCLKLLLSIGIYLILSFAFMKTTLIDFLELLPIKR